MVLPDWGGMGPVAFLSGWNMDAAAFAASKARRQWSRRRKLRLIANPGFRTSPPLAGLIVQLPQDFAVITAG